MLVNLMKLATMANVTNMAKFCQMPNLCKLAKHREDYHVGESDKCGDHGKYGKLSSNCQTYANWLNIDRLTMLANLTNLAIVANRVKFCRIAKLM